MISYITNDVIQIFMDELRYEKQEILKLLILNNKNEIIKVQDIGKGNDLPASRIDTIADDHIVRIVGRSDVLQSAILLGFLHRQLQEVEAIVQKFSPLFFKSRA